MQIKTTVSYQYTLIKMAEINKIYSDNTKYCKDAEEMHHSWIADGNIWWRSRSERQWKFFHKTKPVIAIRPSNCTLRYLSQKNGNLCSHKNSWMNVQSSFICKSQKTESVQISFNRWMVKQIVVYTHHAILQSNKKKLTIDTTTGQVFRELYWITKSKSQKGIYSMIPLIGHFWNDKTLEIESRSVVSGKEEKLMVWEEEWRNFDHYDRYGHYLDCGIGFTVICLY